MSQNKLAALLSAFDAEYDSESYGNWQLPGKDGYFHDGSRLPAHCFVGEEFSRHGLEYSDDGTVEGLARWWVRQQLGE